MYDVVVWAAVSTPEQAEKASIEHQLKLAQEWIDRNGARKVAELVVPGHTREYTFLHDIMREIPAYAQLIDLISGTKERPGKAFNLLLAYDHTRLARGEALLAQIREFLGENGIQIGYTSQFMPLVPPDEFDYRQAFSVKALSAFQGIAAAQEMGTLRARAKFGKESKAESGFYLGISPPYGFTKVKKGVLGPVDEEIAVIKRMHRLYLEEGLGLRSVAVRMNREGYRTRKGNLWTPDTVRKVMFNLALLGKVAYGATRAVKIPAGNGLGMVKKRIHGNPIVRNAHEPVISEERYQHLVDELERRRNMRRGASVTTLNVHVLSGVLVCDYCGSHMYAVGIRKNRDGQKAYCYQCYAYQKNRNCRSNYSSSRRLEEQAEAILRQVVISADLPTAVQNYVTQHDPASALTDVAAQLKSLSEKHKRLEDAYLDGAINLTAFKERQVGIQEKIHGLTTTKMSLEAVQSRASRRSALLERLTDLLSDGTPLETTIPRPKLKLIYRELFESMTVRDGVIVGWKRRV
jgi:site-specific DNA recombinase